MPSRLYDPNARVMTQAEVDAFHADKRVRKNLRAERKARLAAEGVKPEMRPSSMLAVLEVGQSLTFPKYKSTTQVSSIMRTAYLNTGNRFTSALAHDLLTGETVIGVKVTRTV